MKKLEFKRRDIIISTIFVALTLILSGGFGYFAGRMEQIELNKTALQELPDLNACFKNPENS